MHTNASCVDIYARRSLGKTTNFQHTFADNWFLNPRLQLARLSARHPDLLDAGITGVSKTRPCANNETVHACTASWAGKCCVPGGAPAVLRSMNLSLVEPLNYSQAAQYKYVINADGGLGNTRWCGYGLLRSLVIAQDSSFSEFFTPLLLDGTHFVRVGLFWHNLVDKVQWLREHDSEARLIAERGAVLLEAICNQGVRDAYWAKALHAYGRLLTKPPMHTPDFEFSACPGSPASNAHIRGDGCVRTPWRRAEDLPLEA